MGGDGGVIASSRVYLRGAGAACHTADRLIKGKKSNEEKEQESRDAMNRCALSGKALHDVGGTGGANIVACPYGRLYDRETAIEALLRRARHKNDGGGAGESNHESADEIGAHVRGLKDLFPVRFRYREDDGKSGNKGKVTTTRVPVCPVTGEELNGSRPAFFLVRDDPTSEVVNVLSDRALREVGEEGLRAEYGPFRKEAMVRLCPSSRELEEIEEKLRTRREEEDRLKRAKKDRKKTDKKQRANKKRRSHDDEKGATNGQDHGHERKNKISKKSSSPSTAAAVSNSMLDAANQARSNVATAVASNAALSSLFSSKNDHAVSEKEKKDNLFAR